MYQTRCLQCGNIHPHMNVMAMDMASSMKLAIRNTSSSRWYSHVPHPSLSPSSRLVARRSQREDVHDEKSLAKFVNISLTTTSRVVGWDVTAWGGGFMNLTRWMGWHRIAIDR